MKKIILLVNLLFSCLVLNGCLLSGLESEDPYYPKDGVIVYDNYSYHHEAVGKYIFTVAYPNMYQPIEFYRSDLAIYSAPQLEKPPFITTGYFDYSGTFGKVYFIEDYNVEQLTLIGYNNKIQLDEKIKVRDLISDDYEDYLIADNDVFQSIYVDWLWFDVEEFPMLSTYIYIDYIDGTYYLYFSNRLRNGKPLILYKVSDKLYELMGEYWDQIVAEKS